MSASVTVASAKPESSGRVKEVTVPIVFTGTYASGGDTLDLTEIAKIARCAGRKPYRWTVKGRAAVYEFEPGTTVANGLIHAMMNSAGGTNGVLTEHSNVSVVSGVANDTIIATFFFSNRY